VLLIILFFFFNMQPAPPPPPPPPQPPPSPFDYEMKHMFIKTNNLQQSWITEHLLEHDLQQENAKLLQKAFNPPAVVACDKCVQRSVHHY
jgi:hypothetical protein